MIFIGFFFKAFPSLQIQIVHRNTKYSYDEEMLYKLDGVKTLGIFAEVSSERGGGNEDEGLFRPVGSLLYAYEYNASCQNL